VLLKRASPREGPRALEPLDEALKRAATGEPGQRARAFYEAGTLAEEQLGDATRALELYRLALGAAPSFLPAVRAVRRLLLARDAVEDALPLFDAEARLCSEPERRAALLVTKGALLEDRLGRSAEARAAYQQAHELDRGSVLPLKELLRADWDGVAEADRARWLERLSAAVQSDPTLRAELAVRRARSLERDLRTDAAIEGYRAALELDPRCVSALESLKRLLARAPGRPETAARSSAGTVSAEQRAAWLVDVLAHEISVEESPTRRTRLRLRYADLLARELGRNDEAVRVLTLAAEEASEDQEIEVLAALADAHERGDDPTALALVLERWADLTNTHGTRIALLLRMAAAYARANADTEAIRALERALAVDPTHVPTLQALGKLYRETQRWDALVRMHLAEASATRDPARRAAAHARVAELYEGPLGSPDEAVSHHLRALAAHPSHAPSFHALARLYRQRGQHRELLELHRRLLDEAEDDARRATLLLAIGAIHEDLLGEPERAVEAYEQVLALDPKSRIALAALMRAGERAGRSDVVVRALDREAELEVDPARKVGLLLRAGELLASADPQAAVVRYRRVLDIDASHRPALASLGRLHHDLGQWDDLVDVHRRELELVDGATQKSLLAATIATLAQEKLGRPEEALSWAKRAFQLDPTNAAVARMLERQLRARNATAELRALFETELASLESTPPAADEEIAERSARVARAAFALGELCEVSMPDPERALAAYRRATVGATLRPDALDACIRILTKLGRTEELVKLLEAEGARGDGHRATSLLTEAARLAWEKLGDAARATSLYEAALARDPGAVAAWSGLEDLHRRNRGGDVDGLARALAGEARVLRDQAARAAALFDLGRLQTRRDAPPAEVRATFETMATLAPRDPVALDALWTLATRTDDVALRERVERALADLAVDPVQRAAHLAYLARRATERQAPEALELWAEAARLDPESLGIARGLVDAAAERGSPEVLADALRRCAALEPEPGERAKLRVRAAQATEHMDPAAAIADLEVALSLSPERQDVADALARLLVAQGDPERAIDLLRKAAQSARTVGLFVRIAHLQGDVCKDAPAATATLARAAQQLGESPELLAVQIDFLERDAQWAAAFERCERLAELAATPEARAEAHLRAGLLALHRLRDAVRADGHLQAALRHAKDVRALAGLAEAAYLRGQFADAQDLAARWAEQVAGSADEGRAWTMAMRAAVGLGDRDGTLRAAVRAVACEGSTGPARQAFSQLLAQSSAEDRAPRLHALVQALREHTRARAADAATYLDLAQVLHRDLGRPHESADVLLEAVRRHPNEPALRRELVRRLVDAGRDREAIALAERRVADQTLSTEAWAELASALSRSERLAWISAPLAVLGADARGPSPRTRITEAPPELTLALAELEADAPVVGLLHALGEALPRLYPADLEGYGTSTRERLTPRGGHALRALFDRVAALFGAPPFELFVHRVRGRGVAVELAEPTYFLVPAWVSELSEPAQTFLAARALSLASARLSVVDKLTPRELEILVASAARIVAPGFGAGLTSEDVLDDQARRIAKLLSRRARRAIDELGPRYAQAPVQDYPAFVSRLQRAASRVALLVADDLERSIDALRRSEREGQSLELDAFLRGSPLAQDLLRFHVSEQALGIRRRFAV
jgi:tetratricopeptide (TPR) repeat protein